MSTFTPAIKPKRTFVAANVGRPRFILLTNCAAEVKVVDFTELLRQLASVLLHCVFTTDVTEIIWMIDAHTRSHSK
jgi:hypothetical protein